MVDFVKIADTGLTLKDLKNMDFMTIYGTFNSKTGEVLPGKDHANHHGLIFKGSLSGVLGMTGSLHKYYNNGDHNYDDFTYGKLISSITKLTNETGIDPSKAVLNNIELGVNISVPFNPDDFIQSLVCYKYSPFAHEYKLRMSYAQVKNAQYYVKIYNKGLQYNIPGNILRFEIKITRMAKIAAHGIVTLSDLTNQKKLSSLKTILLDVFNSIIYCDDTIKTSSLSGREADLIRDGNNPRFWRTHLKQTGSNASKKVRCYQKLIREHGAQGFHVIRELINDKWDELVYNYEAGRVLTTFMTPLNNENRRVFTDSGFNQQYSTEMIKQTDITISYISSIEKEIIINQSTTRKCLVTGHDISMQKEGSRFLGTKGIRSIHDDDPELFNKLLSQLPPRWKEEPLKRQIYGIAHHVRDQFFNRRNYTRRAIDDICSRPALFDNTLLISNEKKEIALQP